MGGAAASAATLRTQLAFLGFTGGLIMAGLTSQFGDFEEQATLAGFAAAESMEQADTATQNLRNEARRLGREFNALPTDVAELQKAIVRMGVSSAKARRELARSALVIDKLGETSAPDAARALFRLAFAQERSVEGAQQLIAEQGPGLASALVEVSEATAEGISSTTKWIVRLQEANTVLGLTAEQLISLSGAFTQVASQSRGARRAATAFVRLISTRMAENLDAFRRLIVNFNETLGPDMRDQFAQSRESFEQFASQNTFELILAVADALTRMSEAASESGQLEEFGAFVEQLGLSSRDIRTFSQLGILVEDLPGLLNKANRQMAISEGRVEGQLSVWERFEALQDTINEQLRSLQSELAGVALTMGGTLVPVVETLVSGFEGLGQTLNQNRLLTALLTGGLFAGLGGLGIAGFLKLARISGGGLSAIMPAGMGSIAANFLRGRAVAGARAARSAAGARGAVGLGMGATRVGQLAGILPGAASTNIGARLAGFIASRPILNRAASLLVSPWFAAVSLLAPVFDSMGDTFREMAQEGSIVGGVLSILAESIAFLGNTLNELFEILFEGLGFLLESIPGIDDAGMFLGEVAGAIDQANQAVTGIVGDGGGPANTGGGSGGTPPMQDNRTQVFNAGPSTDANKKIFSIEAGRASMGGNGAVKR